MTDIAVFQRHEKKFLMNVETMERILPEIRKHMDFDRFCQDGRTYAVSNLYFDTENNDVIRESLQKPFYKEKLRMRCYGIPKNNSAQVFLEMKKKINKIVTKRRAKMTYGDAKRFLYRGYFPQTDDYMTKQVLKEIQYYLCHKNVYASTRISYERCAFFDREDPSFRLTFDENLYYLKGECPKDIGDFIEGFAKRGGVNFQEHNKGKRIIPENLRLMEVKVSNAYPMWFSKLISDDSVFATSFSKYGVSYKRELLQDEFLNTEMFDILSHI